MNVGKTLFAQVMEFVPWKSFGRIIERHKGDVRASTTRMSLCPASAYPTVFWATPLPSRARRRIRPL